MSYVSKIKLPNESEPRLVKDNEARNIANSKAADAVFIVADPTATPPVEAKRGLVPAPPSTPGATKYLREDCTWAVPAGVTDYTQLDNKPQINSVTLTGNQSAADLSLQKEITIDVAGTATAIADANNSTEFLAGSNVTITGDTTNGTITIAATDTTYESKQAASGGTDVSLVTTGEKYLWSDKQTGILMDIPDTEHPEQTVTTRIIDGNKNTKFIAGTNVTLTPDTTNGTITFSATDTTYTDFVGSGTGHAAGLVPDPGSTEGDAKFLCEDGSWASPSVTVAGDSTDTVVATAKLVAGSNVIITPDTTNHTVTIAATGGGGETSYQAGTGLTIDTTTTPNTLKNTGVVNVTTDNANNNAANGTVTITKLNAAGSATEETVVAVKGLDDAAYKDVDATISAASTSTNLPTSQAVASFVEGKEYLTNADGNIFSTSNNGLVPAADGTGETGKFLKGDHTWATPANTTYTVETGTANGKIKVTPSDDTAYEVPVYGLNNAAYKDVDSTPTQSSTKLVESGGVYTALAGKLGTTDNAASAAKLNNGTSDYSVGSTSKGVYFNNGIPVAMTCTVETSVPQNAVFTDTTYTGTGAISINSSNVISVADGAVGTKGVVELSTSIPAASSAVDTKVATEKAVASAIEALPEPMVFRGTLGTGGTITSLPVDGTASKGDTYKVITAGTYAGETAKIGDTFICNTKTAAANTWVLIPSGDEPSGTVTNVATEKGITTASGSAITDTGTLKLKLKSETALTGAVLSPDTTTAKIYPATIDKDGYVSVPVPWTDTNTTYSFSYSGTKLTISANS